MVSSSCDDGAAVVVVVVEVNVAVKDMDGIHQLPIRLRDH